MGNNPSGGLGGLLGSLFGQQAPTRQQDYQNLNQQYQRYVDPNDPTDHSQFDPQQVQQQYRHMLRNAPPQVMEDAHQQAFEQLNPQQREELARQMFEAQQQQGGGYQQQNRGSYQPQFDPRQLAQDPRQMGRMMQQTEQQNPGVLDQLFGNAQGPLNNPLAKMAIAGAAAAAARHFLGGSGGAMAGSALGGALSGGGLGSALGGVLGGGALGGATGGGLGGMLGGLLGGQNTAEIDPNSSGGFGGSGPSGGTDV